MQIFYNLRMCSTSVEVSIISWFDISRAHAQNLVTLICQLVKEPKMATATYTINFVLRENQTKVYTCLTSSKP